MKFTTRISLGALIFSTSCFEASALECPLVGDVLRTTKCIYQSSNLYKCEVNHPMIMKVSNQDIEHGRWSANFESQVDITQAQGSNQLIGHHNGPNSCSYRYQTPALQVNYDVTYK